MVPMGDAKSSALRLSFNAQLHVEFRGGTATSDAGLLIPRESRRRRGPYEDSNAAERLAEDPTSPPARRVRDHLPGDTRFDPRADDSVHPAGPLGA
jgi:hypothetical protein